jgi:hypothetical protein
MNEPIQDMRSGFKSWQAVPVRFCAPADFGSMNPAAIISGLMPAS